MIKEAIQDINNLAINSGLVERYGKYCTLRTDKKYPYGYGLEDDCFGNTYSFDERFKNVAFLELFTFNFEPINSRIQWLNIELRLHHFLNQKHQDIEKYYGVHLQLYYLIREAVGKLKKWMNTSFNISPSFVKIDNCEYTVMTLNLRTMVSCDYVPDLDPDGCIVSNVPPDMYLSIQRPFVDKFTIGEEKDVILKIAEINGGDTNGQVVIFVQPIIGFDLDFDINQTTGGLIPVTLDNPNWSFTKPGGSLILRTDKKILSNSMTYVGVKLKATSPSSTVFNANLLPGTGGDINPLNNTAQIAISVA